MQTELKNIVWQEGPHFISQCLDIDVASFGCSKEEAVANLKEALELYFEDASPDAIQPVLF